MIINAWKGLILLLVSGFAVLVFTGCAGTPDRTDTRLATMSDAELISYYHGISDRLKAIQQGTREDDRQGTVVEQDQLAKVPYIIGGEAWELERKRDRIKRELDRRHLNP